MLTVFASEASALAGRHKFRSVDEAVAELVMHNRESFPKLFVEPDDATQAPISAEATTVNKKAKADGMAELKAAHDDVALDKMLTSDSIAPNDLSADANVALRCRRGDVLEAKTLDTRPEYKKVRLSAQFETFSLVGIPDGYDAATGNLIEVKTRAKRFFGKTVMARWMYDVDQLATYKRLLELDGHKVAQCDIIERANAKEKVSNFSHTELDAAWQALEQGIAGTIASVARDYEAGTLWERLAPFIADPNRAL